MIILYENMSLFLGLANISRRKLVLTTVDVILTAIKTHRTILKTLLLIKLAFWLAKPLSHALHR